MSINNLIFILLDYFFFCFISDFYRQPQITTKFGHGEGVNTITNLRCNGSESSIRECVFNWVGKTTCTQGQYAGVICSK